MIFMKTYENEIFFFLKEKRWLIHGKKKGLIWIYEVQGIGLLRMC